ncbi:MAG: hypothetical protein H6703_07935 [Myxococcales bacterium]|nr:hypothetical protein [Myxococcales bacterium]
MLDGSPSSADAVAFTWRAVQAPDGAVAEPVEAFFDPADPAAGGFPDDPASATAVVHLEETGRYVFALEVAAADGARAPTPACPAHAYVVVEVGAAAPSLAPGALCDRARSDRCAPPTTCRMTAVDGDGVCDALWRPIAEVEPNQTTADATPLPIGPAVAVRAVVGGLDPFDTWRLTLPVDARIAVLTTSLDGTCSGDTRLSAVDAASLDGVGYPAAVRPPRVLAQQDGGGLGLCARMDLELPAGSYFFVVDDPVPGGAFAYALRAVPLRILGERCDGSAVEDLCAGALRCADPDGDGDGVCVSP